MDDHELERLYYATESSIHGMGLFAKIEIEKGRYMGSYQGPETQENDTYVLWYEGDDGEWNGCDGKNLLRYINHRKPPCAEFSGLDLYAIHDIKIGEEITIDYGDESGFE